MTDLAEVHLKESTAPKDVADLIARWINDSSHLSDAHMQEAIFLRRRHFRIGVPSAVLSAIVGTSIFAALEEASELFWLKVVLASISITAAALTALVTFLNYSERAAAHRFAAQEYKDVNRRLDVLKASVSKMKPDDWRNVLDGYSQRLESIGRRVDFPDSLLVRETRETERVYGLMDSPANGPVYREVSVMSVSPVGQQRELEKLYNSAAPPSLKTEIETR